MSEQEWQPPPQQHEQMTLDRMLGIHKYCSETPHPSPTVKEIKDHLEKQIAVIIKSFVVVETKGIQTYDNSELLKHS